MSVCIWEFAFFFFLSCVPFLFVRRALLSPTGIRFRYLWHATWHREAFCTYKPAFGLGVYMSGVVNHIRSDQIILLSMSYFILYLLYLILQDSLW